MPLRLCVRCCLAVHCFRPTTGLRGGPASLTLVSPRAPQNPRSRTVAMAENKTRPTDASVEDYIAARGTEQQRADCQQLMALLTKVTRRPPQMWGPSIVGFGSYRYTYESGRTGEAPAAGFAIRGRELVVYLVAEGAAQRSLLSKLGKHKMGKACLYFKQLADLDRSTLEKLVVGSVAEVRRRYGSDDGAEQCIQADAASRPE